jgi:predicted alpha-1,2-mannosidase
MAYQSGRLPIERPATAGHPRTVNAIAAALLLCATTSAIAIARSPAPDAATSRPLFASSFEAGQPQPVSTASGPRVAVVAGPGEDEVLTARPRAGFTGTHALRYAADAGHADRARLFDTSLVVAADTQLSYLLFPVADGDGDARAAASVVVDLQFADGTRLSQLGARDANRTAYTARGQGAGRVLYANQWNAVDVDLGRVARGRTVTGIWLAVDAPSGSPAFHGYLDDIRIGAAPAASASMHPGDYVDTRRGSNSNGHFSRGNTFPAVALPHGFNFWTPTTDAGSNWIYQYQERNDAANRPRIEAFALSHEPSPWMGDRQTFQVMPAMADGTPPLDRKARALSFDHAHETARADLYRVRFDNGIVAAMTPTDHAAMLRFSVPGRRAQLLFDNKTDDGGIVLDPAHRSISGWSDVASRLSAGATRLFFHATFDRPVIASGRLTGHGRDHVAAWFGFDVGDGGTVTMRIATSLISVEQARRNLQQEIAGDDTFDSVARRARKRWDEVLGKIEIPGAAHGDKVTLYSNLYRLFLYPNKAFENVGTPEQPDWRYASPFSPPTGHDTPVHTGARIMRGKPYVNNGFWDTYRTAWPAYALLAPTQAGEMIDGFVQQYRDGGWIARWSSPGYADLMVGTSADVAFADAWLKGVRNFDVRAFYQAALKDATVVSPVKGAGRKGLSRSIFTGYTDTSVGEGLSWSMAGYLNDFGIARLAAALATDHDVDDPYAGHYADDAAWFRNRALNYVHLFDPATGFFVGRKPDGSWRSDAPHFDPFAWGGDYTETNAWNMAFDAPYDGNGLANLYGGRDALARKLDAFLAAPGTFRVGTYDGVIHEMLEARAVRMGQYGQSNQPSHHILYMYDLAGQPWKTQDTVRDALRRLYVGSRIGQGYPGDEDNGEMSAWWLFSAAGFYPLRVGTPTYAIGAPYFPHMVIHLENGKRIVIDAPQVSDTNRYIQGVTLDGKPYDKTWLAHADLADGAVLQFRMGPEPSRWGAAADALPPSLTPGDAAPRPLADQTGSGAASTLVDGNAASAAALVDDTSGTTITLHGAAPTVDVRFGDGPRRVSMYTLTSAAADGNDPRAWQLQGSNDGSHWTMLDSRTAQSFAWRRQTRVFGIARPGEYSQYRWRIDNIDGARDVAVAELELLGPPTRVQERRQQP